MSVQGGSCNIRDGKGNKSGLSEGADFRQLNMANLKEQSCRMYPGYERGEIY